MRKNREPKLGAKGTCRNCGFPIVVRSRAVDPRAFRPRLNNVWVHPHEYSDDQEHCMWRAEPIPHSKPRARTLYEQINDRQHVIDRAQIALEYGRDPVRALAILNEAKSGPR